MPWKPEASIDQFIERRACERADGNWIEEEWAISERRYRERQQERNRELWRSYHLERADCLERTVAKLAASHRSKALALSEGE
jgi:hypothetical protein